MNKTGPVYFLPKPATLHRWWISIPLLLLVYTSAAQFTVQGRVFEARTTEGLAGITVELKGRQISTQTTADGSFTLTIERIGDVLVFKGVGFKMKEEMVRDSGFLTVKLKLACNIDYFDDRRISLGVQSGLNHSPYGGYLQVSLPYLHMPGVFKFGGSYQAGPGSSILRIEARYDHMVSECDFRMDLDGGHTKINLANKVDAQIYYSGTNLHFERVIPSIRYLRVYAGFGQMAFYESGSSRWRKYVGPLVGLGSVIFRKPAIDISGRVSFFKHHPEFRFQAVRSFRHLKLFSQYYKLNEFTELTIGAGWSFYYRKKAKGHN